MNRTAAIVFMYDFDEGNLSWLDKQIGLLNDTTLVIVVLHVTGDQEELRSIFSARDVDELFENDLIAAFYRCKIKIDAESIETFSVICSDKSSNEINYLCQILFTRTHKWNLVTPGGKPSINNDEGSRAEIEGRVKQYLSSLDGNGEINIFTSPLIPNDIFYHGFCGRKGGISTMASMESLNMLYKGSKRDPPCVIAENHKRLSQKVPFDVSHFEIARATHGNGIFEVGSPRPDVGYDGVVTNQERITVAAPGSDCIIMLYADPVKRVCGATHCGWKGTVARICINMLRTMQRSYGSNIKDIKVVMGPSICKKCFEFGADDCKIFEDISPDCVLWPEGENRKPTIDLRLANRILLQSEGILPENIDDRSLDVCTVANPKTFFSFRRDGRPFGNQCGFIGIKHSTRHLSLM